jgi:hypothetical protein
MEHFFSTLFRHVVRIFTVKVLTKSLEKDFDKRPSPDQMLHQHPWVLAMQGMDVDMERWIKEAWGWS